jgi:hypothetical protein
MVKGSRLKNQGDPVEVLAYCMWLAATDDGRHTNIGWHGLTRDQQSYWERFARRSIPSLLQHFKERLTDQAVIDAVAEQQAIAELYGHWNDGIPFPGMEENKRRRYAQLAKKPGVQESWKAGVRKQADELLAAAFPDDNTDSKEAPDA